MKNNRLNQNELYSIEKSVERIRELASLGGARFCADEIRNEEIKKSIRCYMMWFDMVAQDIEKAITERKY